MIWKAEVDRCGVLRSWAAKPSIDDTQTNHDQHPSYQGGWPCCASLWQCRWAAQLRHNGALRENGLIRISGVTLNLGSLVFSIDQTAKPLWRSRKVICLQQRLARIRCHRNGQLDQERLLVSGCLSRARTQRDNYRLGGRVQTATPDIIEPLEYPYPDQAQ